MLQFVEGALTFSFPDGWEGEQYDRGAFYRNTFNAFCDVQGVSTGCKAVDMVAIGPDSVAWLIEVRDYSQNPRTKQMELSAEVALKVRDTLAGLLVAARLAADPNERHLADGVVRSTAIHVVLHVETAPAGSPVFDPALDAANVLARMRRLLKPVDTDPYVVCSSNMSDLGWSVA